jgi:Ca-activated chloride channel family protein
MDRSLLLRLALVTLAAGAAPFGQQTSSAAQTAPPAQPIFRAGVDVVSLSVTAMDGSHRYVTDLEKAEISVFEDGVRQDVTYFTRLPRPIALSLLLDSSASMEGHLPMLQAAATHFVRRLKPSDLAQVVDFDSRVEIRQGFTADEALLETAIRSTTAGGATALYNAIYIALRELDKVRPAAADDLRRKALIVFSDGDDTTSLVSFDDVMNLAKRSDTAIYTIALRGPDTGPTRSFREGDFVLRSLAQQTGGRTFSPTKVEDLAAAYAQIADELACQYTIGYTSTNPRHDGTWRRVALRLTRPNVTARARDGYYAATAP